MGRQTVPDVERGGPLSGPDRPPTPLATVVVPCLGRLEATRRCVGAVLRHTRRPWELVAVTRGGADATAAYLAGVADAAGARVAVVAAPGARGTRDAWRLGLAEARGELVALLDGRAVVTDAWLDLLEALAGSDPAVGMVAPMGDAAAPPQLVAEAEHDGPGPGLDAFARRWREARRGGWLEAEALSGPCLVLKRGVLEATRPPRGWRAADLRPARLSRRVRRAGFRLAVAHDLYVHGGRRDDAPPPAGAAAAAPPRRRCRVSLTMIVRDEEHNLPDCLASVAGLFDETIVLDTGSTDRTVEVARTHGARVFDFAWVGDFAAARNAALARATGDYAFWLDADDRVEPAQRGRLGSLLDGLRSADSAYVVRCACDPEPGGGGATVVDHVRLFPVREDVRWSYRVHEQILPALRRAGVAVRWSDVVVRHVGYNDPALRRRKLGRDRAILEAELAERPDDPFVLFNLGAIALEGDDPRAAVGLLRRSLAGSAPGDSITRKLHALIARGHQLLGEPGAALAACAEGLAVDPDDAELLFRKGAVHRRAGERAEARACWRRVLTLSRPERFSSLDEGIYGHVTRRNLAALAEEDGDRAEAALHWSAVLAERPGDAEATAAMARLARPGGAAP